MARLKTSLICLVLMASVKSSQAQHDPSLSGQVNISVAEAVAGAANAKHWMQMQNSLRTSGSRCSNDTCVKSCEQDWEKNGEHCYLWSTDKKTWTDAEDFCRKEGGHLASVHSNATFNFLLEGINRTGLPTAWLGGNDLEVEGTWKWVDCSPWNLTFWARREPNNFGGPEDCLVLAFRHISPHLNHKWNDGKCGSKLGFVCSKSICSGDNEHSVSTTTGSTVTGSAVTGSTVTGSAATGKSVSEPTGSPVTGESVIWKSVSISLIATLLLLIFF